MVERLIDAVERWRRGRESLSPQEVALLAAAGRVDELLLAIGSRRIEGLGEPELRRAVAQACFNRAAKINPPPGAYPDGDFVQFARVVKRSLGEDGLEFLMNPNGLSLREQVRREVRAIKQAQR